MKPLHRLVAIAIAFALPLAAAQAETRVTYKSAKTGTSYYQMGVQIAEAVKAGTDSAVILTVEESQGSVQNVMEAAVRPGNYVFTSPPALVGSALEGAGPFKDRPSPKFAEIRALFPIPSLTMHFVVRADAGVDDFTGLAGKKLLIGKGSFGANEGKRYLEMFGLQDKVEVADVELSNAVAALKNGQIDGFVTAGSFPAPNVMEAAAGSGVRLVPLTDEQVGQTKRARIVIPAGTYPGQDQDVVTTSLPVVAYATTAMDDDTAYLLTRTYWEQKEKMGAASAWWKGVDFGLLANISTKLHPGAIRYYTERGARLDAAHQ